MHMIVNDDPIRMFGQLEGSSTQPMIPATSGGDLAHHGTAEWRPPRGSRCVIVHHHRLTEASPFPRWQLVHNPCAAQSISPRLRSSLGKAWPRQIHRLHSASTPVTNSSLKGQAHAQALHLPSFLLPHVLPLVTVHCIFRSAKARRWGSWHCNVGGAVFPLEGRFGWALSESRD